MSGERFPITPAGYKKLEVELHKLKTVERPNVIVAIAEARAHGDLSENAEYHAAKEKQGFIEARIADLEARRARAQVIDVEQGSASEVVQFGATVDLKDEESGEEVSYKIVGDYEADLTKSHLSISSPVAKALVGKRVGDSIEVVTPKGSRYYEVLSFKFV